MAKCKKCEETFPNKMSLRSHIGWCYYPKRRQRRVRLPAVKNKTIMKKVKCKDCKITFRSRIAFNQHIEKCELHRKM